MPDEDHGEGIVGPRPETATGGPVPSPALRGYTWWCGDDVCDCTQPIVERRVRTAGPSQWERVWEGTFASGYLDSGERAGQEAELRGACERLGAINLDIQTEGTTDG